MGVTAQLVSGGARLLAGLAALRATNHYNLLWVRFM